MIFWHSKRPMAACRLLLSPTWGLPCSKWASQRQALASMSVESRNFNVRWLRKLARSTYRRWHAILSSAHLAQSSTKQRTLGSLTKRSKRQSRGSTSSLTHHPLSTRKVPGGRQSYSIKKQQMARRAPPKRGKKAQTSILLRR